MHDPRAGDGSGASAPTVLGGRYELTAPLGSGGEATVWVARDLVLGRDVAVKVFRRRSESPASPDLQTIEARVAASLNHYALTTLLDVGVGEGPDPSPQLYLVMEYIRGESLKQRLARGPMEVSEACWLGFDVAEGLDYMHQSGYLHRDVKPANVLIAEVRSARPVVAKLTDFGITSRIGEPELGQFTVGTAAYLSPEQVEGRDATAESDIYSLGLVLLEAITGRVEYPGPVERSAFDRLVRDPVVPDIVPRPVGEILERMTARAPRDRISLHDVAVGLQQFLVDDLLQRRGEPAAAAAVAAPAAQSAPMSLEGLTAPEQLAPPLELATLALRASRAMLAFEDGTLVTESPADGSRIRTRWLQAADDATSPRLAPADPAELLGGQADPRGLVLQRPLTASDGRHIATLTVLGRTGAPLAPADDQLLDRALAVLRHDVELRLAMRRALFRE
ncbi:serine/threonine-protein kinase [Amnibacterium sp. CER49]|uniref:serine/threonine-protein kinase n=1 Tax=Amnibacterium sp. CER49 TaxID=3039161 RepID=UPI0024492D17|nr:serine/threonine-protein kinase [Amnibacterium sp. CER49]MDH2444056.1 serine/threonine-protein kinase [Amnibacterium sp. CER49]